MATHCEVLTMTPKSDILNLRLQGMSYGKIASKLNCPKATVAWVCKNPDSSVAETKYNWDEIQKFYQDGAGVRHCIKHFGMSSRTWNKAVKRGDINLRPKGSHKIPISDLLVENRTQTSRTHLKMRLIREGLLQEQCYECGLIEWRGIKLSLHLDHINGKAKDNRIENLRLLCPNCHSLTTTYAGKNAKRNISS